MPDPTLVGGQVLEQVAQNEVGGESRPDKKVPRFNPEQLKALHQSGEFFAGVELKTNKILEEKQVQLETILNRMSQGQQVSETEIRETLGINEDNEENNEVFRQIYETLHECKPEGDLDPRFEVFKSRLEERVNKENRMKVEMGKIEQPEK